MDLRLLRSAARIWSPSILWRLFFALLRRSAPCHSGRQFYQHWCISFLQRIWITKSSSLFILHIALGNEASVYSRFHFRPHFYQHASFRLVETDTDTMLTSDTDAPGPYVSCSIFINHCCKLVNSFLLRLESIHFGVRRNLGCMKCRNLKKKVVGST